MKRCFALLLIASVTLAEGQTVYQLTAYDYYFDPDTINAVVGDEIHLTLTTTEHNFTEVYDTTWAANHNTWNGGFAFGPGTANPGSHFIFTLDSVGTIWYVCGPHAEMGMKGIINVADAGTGFAQRTRSDAIRLIPNPATDQLTVVPSSETPYIFVLIYDAQGRNVMSIDIHGISMVDIRQLDPGTYVIISTDQHGAPVAHEKLMVLR